MLGQQVADEALLLLGLLGLLRLVHAEQHDQQGAMLGVHLLEVASASASRWCWSTA